MTENIEKHLQELHEQTVKAVQSQEEKGKYKEAKRLLLGFLSYRQDMLALDQHAKDFREQLNTLKAKQLGSEYQYQEDCECPYCGETWVFGFAEPDEEMTVCVYHCVNCGKDFHSRL